MLPAPARLRRRQDFSEVVARSSGAVRVARGALVAHVDVPRRSPDADGPRSGVSRLGSRSGAAPSAVGRADVAPAGGDTHDAAPAECMASDLPVRIGFVVSRAVGGAVVRNTVRRRLRHLAAERIDRLPPGARVVVRALPAAAGAPAERLGRDLDAALAEARRRLDQRRRPSEHRS